MVVALVPSPPPAGVALYAHVGGIGGCEGGARRWRVPSQSTMYSTYTKLPVRVLVDSVRRGRDQRVGAVRAHLVRVRVRVRVRVMSV